MADAHLLPVYTWRDARDAGMTRAQRRDDGVRVTRGAYVSRAEPLGLLVRCTAVARVLPPSAAFSHETAAAVWGAPVPEPGLLHAVVPNDTVRPRRRGLTVGHRDLAPGDVGVHRGLRVTSPAQTWLDLCSSTTPGELLAIGDALVRAGHLDSEALARRLARAGGGRGVVLGRAVAPRLDGGAASRPESLIRWDLIDSPLPDPEVQVPVHDRWGRVVAHHDLGYRRVRVGIEYEGRQHADREQFRRDVDRYSLSAADGWLLLRFADVHLARRDVVVDRVARALASRGVRW